MMKISYLAQLIILLFINYSLSAQDVKDTNSFENEADTTVLPVPELKMILTTTFIDFDTSTTINDKFVASNRLVLIANKWTDQWAAQYYAGYSLITLSFFENEEAKKDAYLDEAENFIKKTKELIHGNEDEVNVLEALIASGRITVKPASRWKQYGDIFNENIEKAKSIQPNNPRIYLLQATSIWHTPKMFGGGSRSAIPYFEKADSLYNLESQDNIFKPFWGKKQNTRSLKLCKEEIAENK